MRIPHLIVVIAVVALGAALLAWSVDNDYYLRILFMMGVYYLCAAGMNVLVGYAGQKSLGQAGLFAAGAYAAALLTTSFDLDPWLAIAAAAVVAGAVRRADRLAFASGPRPLSRNGHAGFRHCRREAGQ